ncbi:Rho-binding antiterminator [Psychromonas sp. KJ10-10]|uniref:Rho-binding antiterminator n=1 Tax=Psychromonas sp. KJ10-10 TaxID=3391823 RepID=UPI0039B4C03C
MLTCNEYDVIELVCLFHYPIKLTMKQGEEISGIAVDTQPNERLKIEVDGVATLVSLNEIAKLQVCIDNPHIKELNFH